ncbi:hypothetical protein CBF34_08570 [Vagococcus penaei]|uniref:LPXTG cell wall anchor domain-containing protein n=1 Tax=Vagococcus penaei TaxID=633807 RepID=UPI000F89BB7E|nr:LPXTG cell wall anchor domain-containing protein [Vagococcus penaei]RST99955.1 hypothetical protein CBF34_08570 [Vagococcus penaei]
MKKVKLTTATLAILAGSVVAPLVSNATETNGNAAVQTSEVAKDEKVKEEATEAPVTEAPVAEASTTETKTDSSTANTGTQTPAPAKPVAKVDASVYTTQINNLTNLSSEEKVAYNQRIQAEAVKGNEAGCQAIVAEAKAVSQGRIDLAAKKAEAKKEVQALYTSGNVKITGEQYEAFNKQIDSATTIAEVEAVVAAAKTAGSVTDAKTSAIREIDANREAGKISRDERNALVTKAQAATTNEEVAAVLVELNGMVAVTDAKEAAKKELRELFLASDNNLNWEDYGNALLAIDAAKTVDEVNSIVTGVKNDIVLADAKSKAKDQINAITHKYGMDSKTYWVYANQVDAATTVDEVNAAVAAAQTAGELKEGKAKAQVELHAIGYLLGQDYYTYKDKIDAAQNLDEVASVLNEAKDAAKLAEAKKEAKTDISTHYYNGAISLDEYYNYDKLISAATSIEEVEALVVDASKLYQTRYDALQEIAGYAKDGKLSKTEKKYYDNAVNAAKTTKEVNDVIKELRAELGIEIPWTPLEPSKPTESTEGSTEGSTEDSKTEGSTEDSKTEGSTEDSKTEGSTEDSKTEGSTEDSKTEGSTEDSKTEGSTEDSKTEGSTEDSKTEGSTEDSKKPVTKPTTDKGNKTDAKKVDAKKVVAKKADAKKLPQTNDTVNAGLVAGGLMSVLTAAFLFFRKGK